MRQCTEMSFNLWFKRSIQLFLSKKFDIQTILLKNCNFAFKMALKIRKTTKIAQKSKHIFSLAHSKQLKWLYYSLKVSCLKGSVVIISLKHGLKHGILSIVWLDRSFYFLYRSNLEPKAKRMMFCFF